MKQVIARAQITITSVYDGADAYNVFLSANALTIPCNADGSDPVLLAARSTVTVMQAGTDITKNCTLTLLTRLNCSAVLSGCEIIITKIDTAQTAGYVEIAVTTPPVNGKKATTNHRLNWSLSRQGTTGADGPPGPSLTSAGYWQKDKVYYMRPDVRTRVIYRVDGKNYLTKQNKVVTAIPMGTLPSDARYWSVFDGQFELVATNVLFAEEAYIGQVNTPAIWIGSGIKGWKIDKEQIESVQQVNGIPKTRLTSNGDIEVTGGSLRILSGTASQSIHEYTKQQLDSVQIGGRNLLRNSNFADAKEYWGTNGADSWTIEKDESFGNAAKVKISVAGRGVYQSITTPRQTGENYTISVYLKADAAMKVLLGHEGGTGSKVVDVTSQWQRYTTQGVWTAGGAVTFYARETGAFYIANAQYEQGNRTTAWTPAVEDIDSQIQDAQNKISQAQNDANKANSMIADIASDDKLTPAEKQATKKEWEVIVSEYQRNIAQSNKFGIPTIAYTDAYNALRSYITPFLDDLNTLSDIDGTTFRATFKAYYDARTDLLNAIASKTKEWAEKAQATADQAGSDARKVRSEYKADLVVVNDKIAAKVSQTDFNALGKRLSTTQSNVSQLAGSITSVVERVENIAVGGRNMLRNSNFADAKNHWGTNGADSWTIEKDESFGNVAKVKTSVIGRGIYQSITTQRQAGANYTISVYLKADAGMKVLLGHEGGTGSKVVDVTSQWQRYTTQGVWKTKGSLTFYGQQTGTFYIANAQYEQGNQTTAWTPAPEDIESRIDVLRNDAEKAQADANKANSMIADIANDNKLTPNEKQETKRQWEVIAAEYSKNMVQADKFGVPTTAYANAYRALNSHITPLLENLDTTSDTHGATFRAAFKAYYDTRTDLLNDISAKAKELADKAQKEAENVRAEYKASFEILDTKIAAKVSQTDFNALGQRVSTTESNIIQQADKIELSVKEKIENLTIGGRNYFARIDWVQGGYFNTTGKLVTNGNVTRIRPSKTQYMEATANEKYCFRNHNPTYMGYIYELDADGNVLKEHGWIQSDYRFTTKPTTTHFAFLGRRRDNANIKPAEIWSFTCKLEKGDKFTDYTPAVEDVQGQIDSKTTLEEVKAGIKITTDGVEAFGNAFRINGTLLAHLIKTDGLDVGNGNFVVEKDGKVTMNDATVRGRFESNKNGNRIIIDASQRALKLVNNSGRTVGYLNFSDDGFCRLHFEDKYGETIFNNIGLHLTQNITNDMMDISSSRISYQRGNLVAGTLTHKFEVDVNPITNTLNISMIGLPRKKPIFGGVLWVDNGILKVS